MLAFRKNSDCSFKHVPELVDCELLISSDPNLEWKLIFNTTIRGIEARSRKTLRVFQMRSRGKPTTTEMSQEETVLLFRGVCYVEAHPDGNQYGDPFNPQVAVHLIRNSNEFKHFVAEKIPKKQMGMFPKGEASGSEDEILQMNINELSFESSGACIAVTSDDAYGDLQVSEAVLNSETKC
jgi:hypothetical protein